MFNRSLYVFAALGALFLAENAAYAFTVINQTDAEKMLIIREAKFVQIKNGSEVRPLDLPPHEMTIPPKQIYTFDLTESCTNLLISVVSFQERVIDNKIVGTKSTTTTAYVPYNYQGVKATHITNDWGVVVHNPTPQPDFGDWHSSQYYSKRFDWEQSVENGYGIKCLHPKALEKVASMDELPKELH